MRQRKPTIAKSLRGIFCCCLLLGAIAAHAAPAPFFTLSTTRTFSPDEKPKLHLYTRNVDELEFRIYHVNDPKKFIAGLPDLHSFGTRIDYGPLEQIDKETWLERFHDWKHHLWYVIRQFFRGQLSYDTREALREKQASIAKRSRIVGVAQFAQIPLLNDKQLVARWRQEMPPTFVSDSQDLPIDALASGLYLVEATDGHLKAYTLLVVTPIAIVTRTGPGTILAYVVDRKTGAPVEKANVAFWAANHQQGTEDTAGDGLADFGYTPADRTPDSGGYWLLASRDSDLALVTPWGYTLAKREADHWAGYTYTDRPVYRPGHTVHWKAILRRREGDHLILPKLATAHVTITAPEDKTIFEKDVALSNFGAATGDLVLPSDAALGYYQIRVLSAEAGIGGSFEVEEYKKPEYQVKVTTNTARVLEGDSVQATINARYFFGEPVANAKVKYVVHHATHYWWGEEGEEGEGEDGNADNGAGDDAQQQDESFNYGATEESEQEGKLDANGSLTVKIPSFFNVKQKYDLDYRIEARVTDAANREISGHGYFLATYGSFRVHVDTQNYVLQPGQTPEFDVTALDYDDKPVQTRVHLFAEYYRWQDREGHREPAGSLDVDTDANGKAHVRFPLQGQRSGSVFVTATANTPEKRVVEDETSLWIIGGNFGGEGEQRRQSQIIADKKSYAPGDVAHLSVISNVDDAYVLLTAEGRSLQSKQVRKASGKVLTFDLPITTDSQPNLNVSAVFIQKDQLYQAQKSLKVPPVQQQLNISIVPLKAQFQPGEKASYEVTAKDASGKPVASDLSFGVVDEAIYSVRPDSSGDIVNALYPRNEPSTEVESSLSFYFTGEAGLKSPMLAEAHRYRPQLAQIKPSSDLVQPKIRKAFPDTAFWNADVHTDANGHARVELEFPDSLTTWRTTVRAVTLDSKAGAALNRVLVRKNIIVRLGAPRFFRQTDEVDLPVIVHNYLDSTKQVQVSLDVTGLDVMSGHVQQISVPSRGEAEAIWRVKASHIGNAKLVAKALTNEESDAIEISLPVEPVGVAQAISAAGALSHQQDDKTVAVVFPSNTDPDAHSIDLDINSSVAGSLFSALDYLTSYPYGCTEQTMSSFLPNIVVAQALTKLNLKSTVDPAELKKKISAGLDRLYDYQHDDGGWGWWKEDQSRVFMTAYVVAGLGQAKAAGYEIDDEHLQNGLKYLRKQLRQHPRMLADLQAYVTYALALNGTVSAKEVDAMWSKQSDLSAEGMGLAGLVLVAQHDSRTQSAVKWLENKAQQDDATAHWNANFDPLMEFETDNSAEATAFALKLLVAADPNSPMLAKIAYWLVQNRDQGYWWTTTKQTAMVLFGLADYLASSHELTPSFDAEVLINGHSAGKQHFSAADAVGGTALHLHLGAAQIQANNTVEIRKTGAGRLYWSTRGAYYSNDKTQYQKGQLTLNLTRDYFRLTKVQQTTTDGGSKITYKLDPLNGPVVSGDILAVHLAVNGSKWKYLLIEDPIPAGTEFIEQEQLYEITDRPSNWGYWYTRREFHDDRAAIFATEFNGRDESFYLLKVVNPGSFAVSPAHVEPMYQPAVQATSDPLRVEVKP